jgi:hypothetical protein
LNVVVQERRLSTQSDLTPERPSLFESHRHRRWLTR